MSQDPNPNNFTITWQKQNAEVMKGLDFYQLKQMTPEQRNEAWGSAPNISNDIIKELSIQFEGYMHYFGGNVKRARELAMKALEMFGSKRVQLVPVTEAMIAVKDYGFRLKE